MPRRKELSLANRPKFRVADVRRLYELARGKANPPSARELRQLLKLLNAAALMFTLANIEAAPTPTVQTAGYGKIEAAAKRLLLALSTPNARIEELPHWLRIGTNKYRWRAALDSDSASRGRAMVPLDVGLEGIRQLSIVAAYGRNEQSSNRRSRPAPNADNTGKSKGSRLPPNADKAANGFLRALEGIWREEFRREDVRTKAFYNFALTAFKAVDPSISDNAVRRRAERLSTKSELKRN